MFRWRLGRGVGGLRTGPVRGRPWRPAGHLEIGPLRSTAFTPDDELLTDWSELLTCSVQSVAGSVDLTKVVSTVRASLSLREADGHLAWSTVSEATDEILHWWAITGSTLVEDQVGVSLVRVRGDVAFLVDYAARHEPTEPLLDRAVALVADQSTGPELSAVLADRSDVTPFTEEELDDTLAGLQRPFGVLEKVDPRAYYRQVMRGVDRTTSPDLWAQLSALVGMKLLRPPQAHRSEVLGTAAVALRRALEVVDPQASPEMWARIVRSLGHAYAGLEGLGAQGAAGRAEHAFRAGSAAFRDLGLALDDAAVRRSLAQHLLSMHGDEPTVVGEAVAVLQTVSEQFEVFGEVVEWASTRIELGDALLRFAALQSALDAEATRASAREIWGQTMRAVTAREDFAGLDAPECLGLIQDLTSRLNQFDRANVPEPLVRDRDANERKPTLLFLRPLGTAGRLRLPNRFTNPGSMAVQFEVEPERMSVEAVLYRVLGSAYSFQSIGGATDGFGGGRWFSVGGDSWQSLFRTIVGTAEMILVVPEGSDGLRWEINELMSEGQLPKCVFVFPPAADDFDTRGLVEGGVAVLRDFGLESPAYDEQGLLFRVRQDGTLAGVLSFDHVWTDTLAASLVR
jgi:hypothetical protein